MFMKDIFINYLAVGGILSVYLYYTIASAMVDYESMFRHTKPNPFSFWLGRNFFFAMILILFIAAALYNAYNYLMGA